MRRFVSYALMLKHLKQVVLLRLRRFLNDDGGAIRQLLTLLQPPAQTKNSFGKFVAFGKIPRVKPRNVDRRAERKGDEPPLVVHELPGRDRKTPSHGILRHGGRGEEGTTSFSQLR